MALTLIATAGAADANSYATVAEATAYFEGSVYPANWTNSTNKAAALVSATRYLDALFVWSGWVSSYTQSLLWPRSGMWYRSGLSVPVTVVPVELKNAVAEFAAALSAENLLADSDIEKFKLRSLTAGPVSLAFDAGVVAKQIPDAVWFLLPPGWGYLRTRGNPESRQLVRG